MRHVGVVASGFDRGFHVEEVEIFLDAPIVEVSRLVACLVDAAGSVFGAESFAIRSFLEGSHA